MKRPKQEIDENGFGSVEYEKADTKDRRQRFWELSQHRSYSMLPKSLSSISGIGLFILPPGVSHTWGDPEGLLQEDEQPQPHRRLARTGSST